MTLERKIAKLFNLTDENWMKHAAIESSLLLCVIIEVTMLRGYMVK